MESSLCVHPRRRILKSIREEATMIGVYSSDTNVYVNCPETGVRTRVTMGFDEDGDPVVVGCARFWGDLRCDTSCWGDAVEAFDLDVVKELPAYCGRPNLGAPRPREV